MKTRWRELCQRYPLTCDLANILDKVWKRRFTKLARNGYYLAINVRLSIGCDRFLHFTWDLASCPCHVAGDLDFHGDFLDRIKQFISPDKQHLLHAAAEDATNALQLYERLRPES